MRSCFSKLLSQLRRESGYSQRKVATDLGISQALLSHYENGAREPKLEFIVRVCDYYNVSADFILGRTASQGGEAELLAGTVSMVIGKLEEIKITEAELISELRRSVTK